MKRNISIIDFYLQLFSQLSNLQVITSYFDENVKRVRVKSDTVVQVHPYKMFSLITQHVVNQSLPAEISKCIFTLCTLFSKDQFWSLVVHPWIMWPFGVLLRFCSGESNKKQGYVDTDENLKQEKLQAIQTGPHWWPHKGRPH